MSDTARFWSALGVSLDSPGMLAPVKPKQTVATRLVPLHSSPAAPPVLFRRAQFFFSRETPWEELELARVKWATRVLVPTGPLVTGGVRATRCHVEGTP
jgi:hypothetical protein